ncbi:HEAT repeat domain-containing protein [Cohnella sp. GCM10020058]|uniref:HEAT repeat domain-containing protein n=1 Tax=Cohnella sp. GCM10020058 TaxID=3317330 RepID=UPI003640ABAC
MEMKEWLSSIGIQLPEPELDALERHAEKQLGTEYEMRWMSVQEQGQLLEAIASIPVYRDLLPLWENSGGDYIAIYRSGPLDGKICVMSHEETDLTPRWRNVISLLERMDADPEGEWRDWTFDYPTPEDSPGEQLEGDRETVEQLWPLWKQEDDEDIRCQTAFAIVGLTPKADLAQLLVLLEDEDMYVQERACERLGEEHFTAAEEPLRELARNGVSNAKNAAARALAGMNMRP